MTNADLQQWLTGKLAEAETALKARRKMEFEWRRGTNKEWKEVGCKWNRAQRLEESARQGRIAKKCEREVEMFKAAIAAICK